MAPKLNWEGGGKAQLLRRGAFRLRRDVGRPTTPCPTPMSDLETGPFSGAQICSAGKRRFPCPPGPKSLETQMLLAPHSFVEQRTYLWVRYPVPTPQCPSPWSLQTPAAQPFPGPHAQRDPLPHFPKEVRSNSARPLAAQALTRQLRAAGGAGRGGGGRRRAGSGGGHSAPRGIVSKIRPLGASRKQLMRPRLRSVTRMAGQWRVEPEVPGWAAARDCHDCTNLPLETLQGTEPNSDLRQKRNWSAVAQANSVPNTDFGSTREPFSPPC